MYRMVSFPMNEDNFMQALSLSLKNWGGGGSTYPYFPKSPSWILSWACSCSTIQALFGQ